MGPADRWQPTEVHRELARKLRAPVPSPPKPMVKPAKTWEGLKLGGCYEWTGRTPSLWVVVDASTAWVHLVPLGAMWPRLSLSDPKEATALRKVRKPSAKKEPASGNTHRKLRVSQKSTLQLQKPK